MSPFARMKLLCYCFITAYLRLNYQGPTLGDGVLLQTCLEWNMVKIERKRRMIGKAGARTEKKMYQRSGRTKRKPAQERNEENRAKN